MTKLQYAISAGPGTLVDYGECDDKGILVKSELWNTRLEASEEVRKLLRGSQTVHFIIGPELTDEEIEAMVKEG